VFTHLRINVANADSEYEFVSALSRLDFKAVLERAEETNECPVGLVTRE